MVQVAMPRFTVFILALLIVLSSYGKVSAEYIFLKDGSIVECKILDETPDALTVRVKDKKTVFSKSNIIRVLYTKLYMGRVYIYKTDGIVLEAHIVDEDQESYTVRADIRKPEEFTIRRVDVEFVSRKKVEYRKQRESLRKVPADKSRGMLGLGPLEIAPGTGCHFPVSRWGRYLKPAPYGQIYIGYGLSGIPAARAVPVLPSFGIAMKFGAIPFKGHTRITARMSLQNMSLSAGLFYNFPVATVKKWSFNIRPYFLVGPSFSILRIRELYWQTTRAANFSYDAQLLFMASYDAKFFIDAGFGYLSVQYSDQPIHSIYPFVQFGILL
jgi:hypothetical protein